MTTPAELRASACVNSAKRLAGEPRSDSTSRSYCDISVAAESQRDSRRDARAEVGDPEHDAGDRRRVQREPRELAVAARQVLHVAHVADLAAARDDRRRLDAVGELRARAASA